MFDKDPGLARLLSLHHTGKQLLMSLKIIIPHTQT